MNTQQITSVARQVVAVLAAVAGILTASVTQLHLPTSVSTVLVAFGGILLTVEHYLGDPSTGTTSPTQVNVTSTPTP
jgi:hypothetical protein